jgi:hypothetical protein
MMKNKLYLLVALPMLIVLGACAAKPAQAAQNNPAGGNFNPSNMPLEQKLAIGTLNLEGTDQAVTTKEATDLLPLWQAVKSLEANANTASSEITAVYKQIEGVMTPDQTQAIQKMTWTQADIQALMTKYGVTFGAGQGGTGGQNLTADQRATRTAQFQSRNQNGGAPGGPGGPGDPGSFPGGPSGPGGAGGAGGQSANGTPQPGRRGGGGGMNTMFVDPLIKLLQTRAAGK